MSVYRLALKHFSVESTTRFQPGSAGVLTNVQSDGEINRCWLRSGFLLTMSSSGLRNQGVNRHLEFCCSALEVAKSRSTLQFSLRHRKSTSWHAINSGGSTWEASIRKLEITDAKECTYVRCTYDCELPALAMRVAYTLQNDRTEGD